MVTRAQIDALMRQCQNLQGERAQAAMQNRGPTEGRAVSYADYAGYVTVDEWNDLWARYEVVMERKADLEGMEKGSELHKRLMAVHCDEAEMILQTLDEWDARKAEGLGSTEA